MNRILTATLVMAILSFIFALILAWASKKFKIVESSKLAEIVKVLPKQNCGKCGFPNCGAFAKAIIEGKARYDNCVVGGEEVAKKIEEIMGK